MPGGLKKAQMGSDRLGVAMMRYAASRSDMLAAKGPVTVTVLPVSSSRE